MRLYILQLGLNKETGSPVPGYLIQTDDGTNVLVDTGFSSDFYQPKGQMDSENFVLNRLIEIGVAPNAIRYVVCTHLDIDHAGSHDLFPDAEFVIQRLHYQTAYVERHPRFANTAAHWGDPRLHYRQVDGDTALLPGIELIESSGHVPGHQAVLVRLPQTGPVILAIDAITRALGDVTPETRQAGQYDMDEAQLRLSTRKLIDLAQREGAAFIVYGHDPDLWPGLRKSPAYYE